MATIQDYQAKIDELIELIKVQNDQIKANAAIIEALKAKLGL